MDQRRVIYFLGGCIAVRTALTVIAKLYPELAQTLAPLALLPVVGWLYIYFVSGRDTGPEVFGGKIWWNELRPLHAMLWSLFSLYAWKGKSYAWILLGADTALGLGAWVWHHMNESIMAK
jgi:hypothetical protein